MKGVYLILSVTIYSFWTSSLVNSKATRRAAEELFDPDAQIEAFMKQRLANSHKLVPLTESEHTGHHLQHGPAPLDSEVKTAARSSDIVSVHVEPPMSEDQSEGVDDEGQAEDAGQPLDAGQSVNEGQTVDGEPGPVAEALVQDEVEAVGQQNTSTLADVYLLAVVAGCAVAALSGLVLAGVCWYRLHKKVKDASTVDYPAYGVTGPACKDRVGSPGDRKLAQSAQMYHYQHQKQQMIASERPAGEPGQNGGAESGAESEEECEDGDYTVFECPGLATAGEMEIRNPMFSDQTPVATPADTNK